MESCNSRNYLEIELTDSIVLIDDLNSDSNGEKVDEIGDSDKVYHSCCVHTLDNQMEDDDDGPGTSETISVTFNERGTPDGKSDTDNEDFVRSESLDSEVDKVEKEETEEKSEPEDYEEEVDEKEEDEEDVDEDLEEKETEEEEIADEDEVEVKVEVELEAEAEAEEDEDEDEDEELEEEEMGELAQKGNGISLETVGLLDDFEAEYEEPTEQEEQEQSPPSLPINEEECLIALNGKSLMMNQYLETNPLIATGISDDQVSLLTKHSNYKRHVIQLNSESSTLISSSPAGSTSSSRTLSKRLSKSSGIKAFKSFHKKITKLFK